MTKAAVEFVKQSDGLNEHKKYNFILSFLHGKDREYSCVADTSTKAWLIAVHEADRCQPYATRQITLESVE